MDFPLPDHWPSSVEVAGEVAYVSHRGFGWRHDAATGQLLEASAREGRLAGEGGTWSIDSNGDVSWTPEGGETRHWTFPGNTSDAAVQGRRLWMVTKEGLFPLTPEGPGAVVDAEAYAVAVHDGRRAVLSREHVSVYAATDRRICSFTGHLAPRGAQQIALDDHYVAVAYPDGLVLLDADTCALLQVAPPHGPMIGIADDRLWFGDGNRLRSASLPDLQPELDFRGGKAEEVLAGPRGPVVWTGSKVYDGATGQWSVEGSHAGLLVRDPDWLLRREGAELVVRDATGAVIARHPTPRLGWPVAAAHIDGDLAVTDGRLVMRLGASPQQASVEGTVTGLRRGPGGVVRVITKEGPVWELRPGEPELARTSSLVLAGLETQGEARSAVRTLSTPGARYGLVLQGDRSAVWDQDTLRVVGSPLPVVSMGRVSDDGRWVAAVSGDALLVLETATGRELWRVPGVSDALAVHLGPRQVIVTDKAGWLVVDHVTGRSLRLARVDPATRLPLMDQLRRWEPWERSEAPQGPAPTLGAALVDEGALTRARGDLQKILPGDPLCADGPAGERWRSLLGSSDDARLQAALAGRCRERERAATWSTEVIRGEPPPSAHADLPRFTRVFDRLSGEDVWVPLRPGHLSLLLKAEDFNAKDLEDRLPPGVDLLLEGDLGYLHPEVWLLSVEQNLDLRQRRVAMIGDWGREDLPSAWFAPEATLVGRGGEVLGQGDLDAVLDAAAWWAVDQTEQPIPARSARRLWTWRAPDLLEQTLLVDGLLLVHDAANLLALRPDGSVAWTRGLTGHSELREGPPLMLRSGGRSTVLFSQDGALGWSVSGTTSQRSGSSVCLEGQDGAVDVETGEIFFGRDLWPEDADPWPCATTPFTFWGQGCVYVTLPGQAPTCEPRPVPPPSSVTMGRLRVSLEDGRVVARQPNGWPAWSLEASGFQALSEDRLLVRLPWEYTGRGFWSGPWITVDRQGRPRERLGLGEALVVDGRVILTSGRTVTAWELP